MAQTVKRLSAMQETQVWSLGWEDPLEKEMAVHSSILAWKVPWMAEPGRLQSLGLLGVGHDWATSISVFSFHFYALEKEMAAHSSIIAWKIPWTWSLVGYRPCGRQELDAAEQLHFTSSLHHVTLLFKYSSWHPHAYSTKPKCLKVSVSKFFLNM